MADNEVNILLNAEDNAREKIGQVKGALDGLGGTVAGIAAAYLTWETAKGVYNWAITGAIESERATNRLKNTIENAGYSWEANQEKIDATTKSMTDLTRYGDEEFYGVMEGLVRITGDLAGSMQNMGLAANVAANFNIDLSTATNYVGRAMVDGHVMIGRVNYSLEELRVKSKDMAANELNTLEGKAADLRDRLSEVGEKIGTKFTNNISPILEDIAKDALDLTEKLGGLLGQIGDLYGKATAFRALRTEQPHEIQPGTYGRPPLPELAGPMGPEAPPNPNAPGNLEVFGPPRPPFSWQDAIAQNSTGLQQMGEATETYINQREGLMAGSWNNDIDRLTSQVDLTEEQMAQLGVISTEEYERQKSLGEDYKLSMIEDNDYIFNSSRETVEAIIQEKARQMTVSGQYSKKEVDDFVKYERQKAAFAQQTNQILMSGSRAVASRLVESIETGQLRLKDVFAQIARDFMMMVIQAITDAIAAAVAKWVAMFLFFDVPENDRRAMQSGKDFARYFMSGAQQEFAKWNLPGLVLGRFDASALTPMFSGQRPSQKITIHFNIDTIIGTEQYVRDNVIPIIEGAAQSFGSKIAVNTYRSAGSDLWAT